MTMFAGPVEILIAAALIAGVALIRWLLLGRVGVKR